jgi:hypothetical protein
MSGAYVIVQQLFNTFQPTAVGIAHFLNALLNFTIAGGTSPVIVEYMNKEGATQVMIFSRQKLSAAFSDAMEIIRIGFGVGAYYNPGFTVTGVLFYSGDGTVQETPVSISQDSWADLMPHVHKIFIRTS